MQKRLSLDEFMILIMIIATLETTAARNYKLFPDVKKSF
jgi:hypothetical protein